MIFIRRVFSCIFRRYDLIKSVLVREIVNSDAGENRELLNFRDCSTDNVITCTRIEANIEKSLSKSQSKTRLSRQLQPISAI